MMFLVTNSPDSRHRRIRLFLPDEPVIAVLLAAVDFEWTLRRAIIALGTNSNIIIRKRFRACHGLDGYKQVWRDEVKSRLGANLSNVLTNWKVLKEVAYPLRNEVVHGVRGFPSTKKSSECVEQFLTASLRISNYATSHNSPLFGKRLPVRRKPRE
jgi:hypothetical protein